MWVESNIAFWNVENLFDRDNDPNRPPELQSKLAGELQGWTAAVRDQKIKNLANIINQMFNGQLRMKRSFSALPVKSTSLEGTTAWSPTTLRTQGA